MTLSLDLCPSATSDNNIYPDICEKRSGLPKWLAESFPLSRWPSLEHRQSRPSLQASSGRMRQANNVRKCRIRAKRPTSARDGTLKRLGTAAPRETKTKYAILRHESVMVVVTRRRQGHNNHVRVASMPFAALTSRESYLKAHRKMVDAGSERAANNICNRQECTRGFNQINICWATAQNPVASLNASMMNETYKDLFRARPSAASYTIDLAQLQTMTSTVSASSTPTQSPTGNESTTPKPTSSEAPASDNSSSGLSGGAIGGIVGGVVGGLALIGGIAFFLWRRKKYSTVAQADPSSPTSHYAQQQHQQQHASYQPDMAYQQQSHEMQAGAPRTEKYGYNAGQGYVGEMPAHQQPVEMSAEAPGRPH